VISASPDRETVLIALARLLDIDIDVTNTAHDA
jgi:hypothetical protein